MSEKTGLKPTESLEITIHLDVEADTIKVAAPVDRSVSYAEMLTTLLMAYQAVYKEATETLDKLEGKGYTRGKVVEVVLNNFDTKDTQWT